jgi:hypothetical protein
MQFAAHAEPTSMPGLWESKVTMHSANPERARQMAEMKKQLQAMPPAQREQMEQMMAARGISLPQAGGAGTGVTTRFCMTREMAAERHYRRPMTAARTALRRRPDRR